MRLFWRGHNTACPRQRGPAAKFAELPPKVLPNHETPPYGKCCWCRSIGCPSIPGEVSVCLLPLCFLNSNDMKKNDTTSNAKIPFASELRVRGRVGAALLCARLGRSLPQQAVLAWSLFSYLFFAEFGSSIYRKRKTVAETVVCRPIRGQIRWRNAFVRLFKVAQVF